MPRSYRPVASKTGHFLFEPIKTCTFCSLREGCRGPVPGVGPEHARVMLVLEAPGDWEDIHGIPVTGATWEEMERLLWLADLDRDSVYISNVTKCKPRSDPTWQDTFPCADLWLPQEVAMVKPYLIVAVGQLAARRLLGNPKLTLEETHGYPVWSDHWGAYVLPVYHPAAAFYNTKTLRWLQEDFREIGKAKVGKIRERAVDTWTGKERYGVAQDRRWQFTTGEAIAIDTETTPEGDLWCLSLSAAEGQAKVFMRENVQLVQPILSDPTVTLVFHNAFYDVPKLRNAGLEVRPGHIYDTMVMARDLKLESAGLKELASRWLVMRMESYQEVVRPSQMPLSIGYLQSAWQVASREGFPQPEPEVEVVWDKKTGTLITHTKKPQPLAKKIGRLLADIAAGKDVDPLDRWKQWGEETAPIVQEIGPHPIAYLAHVEPEHAVWYASRDADATRRLFFVLKALAEEEGMWDVIEMDAQSLPMIHEMMWRGIKVDTEYLRGLADEFSWRRAKLEGGLWEAVGYAWNPGSTHQTAQALFGALRLPHGRATKGGKLLSTDDEVLKPLLGRAGVSEMKRAVVKDVLEWRKLYKNENTYILPYIRLAEQDVDGRIHTDYSGMTETDRLAAKEPNVMALPKRSEEGRRVRMGFEASD